jgi:hypothetical protein
MNKIVIFLFCLLTFTGAAVLAQDKPEEKSPAPAPVPAQAPAMPEVKLSPFILLLRDGVKLADEKRHYDACLLFHKIVTDGDENENYFKEAEFELAKNLFNLKLYISSFSYFDRIVEAGASHPRYKDTLSYLLEIHKALPGDTSSLVMLAEYPESIYPPDLADQIHFYAGQHDYYQMNLDRSLEHLSRVTTKDKILYLKATYLKGAVLVRKNLAKEASEAFKDILRFIKTGGYTGKEYKKHEDLAFLSLARIFYTIGDFETSIKYYDEISDSSPHWLETLFEKSWAYFQTTNYPRALGNLHTLNSPYFEEEYFPESYILKAVIMFYTCNYSEALQIIDPFYKDYWELMKELENLLKEQTDPSEFYKYLAKLSVKGGNFSLKLKRIFNAALADMKIRRGFTFIVQINQEISQVEEMRKHIIAKRLADLLLPDLLAYRSLMISEAGKLANARLSRILKELKSQLSQALKIKFEALNAQKGMLQAEIKAEQSRNVSKLAEPYIDDEHQLWPFDGEYWKDELGSYFYPVENKCR